MTTEDLNEISLIGSIVSDVEMIEKSHGGRFGKFDLLVTSIYNNREGRQFFKVCVFNEKYFPILESLKISNKVFVRGLVRTRKVRSETSEESVVSEIVVTPPSGRLGIFSF